MKQLIKIIPFILVFMLLSGCGSSIKNREEKLPGLEEKSPEKTITQEEQIFSDQFQTVSELPVSEEFVDLLYLNSLTEAEPLVLPTPEPIDETAILESIFGANKSWPAEYLAPDMPAYTKGEIVNWIATDGEQSIDIVINGTNEQELEEYLLELEKNGFSKDYDTYSKGLFTVEASFNFGGKLWISSYQQTLKKWPQDILGFVPPLEKGLLINMDLTGEEADIVFGYLSYIDLTREELDQWISTLTNSGFENDNDQIVKYNVQYKGKEYKEFSISIESMDEKEWSLYYYFENN
ncbi:MAG: hypothetical protein KBA53_00320 [Thermoclostridium sp.]|nr:hypothetical protein [Thermoclostridium sp.]